MYILIIGTTLDDVNYLRSKMRNTKEEQIAKHFNVVTGVYAEREIIVAYSGFGGEFSSMLTGLIIQKYNPYLLLHVGTVSSIDANLKQGDLFIAQRVYLHGVDLGELMPTKYGQFPDLPAFFSSDSDLMVKIQNASAKSKAKQFQEGVLLSGNVYYTKKEDVAALIQNHFLRMENVLAVDTESGGVALAAHLFAIPYVALKICNYEVGNEKQKLNRIRIGLEQTPVIGQIIATLLKDLGEII